MRDGYLYFLMGIAGVLVIGYVLLVLTVVRRQVDAGGCLLWVAGLITAGVVSAILATVGHAVGVNASELTGWR